MNKPKLDHLYRMTDMVGIAEHCLIATPDLREGYCVDDNARALQVALRLKEEKLVDTYLKFLVSAAGEYGFKNDMNKNLVWENEPIGDNFGRAMAALAETAVNGIREDQKLTALFLFDQYAHFIDQVKPCRTKAWLIYALYLRLEVNQNLNKIIEKFSRLKIAQGKISQMAKFDSRKIINKMADDMIKSYKNSSDNQWQWFEDKITYDNGRLPWGLLWAYKLLGDKTYLNIALKSLDFLTKNIFNSKQDFFSFPGNKGWFTKSGSRIVFDQQPIEAGSMVEVYTLAYQMTQDPKYKKLALRAFNWYHGKNILGVSLINPQSGGVYNGLEKEGVNLNQGAESLLSYLLAHLFFKD